MRCTEQMATWVHKEILGKTLDSVAYATTRKITRISSICYTFGIIVAKLWINRGLIVEWPWGERGGTRSAWQSTYHHLKD